MPYSIVGSVHEFSRNAVGVTTVDAPAFTPTAGNHLLAIISYSHGTAAQSATLSDTTGSNDTWNELETGAYASLNGMRAFLLDNAAAASTTVRATFGANVDYPTIVVVEISGLHASAFLDAAFGLSAAPGQGADAITSGNLGTLSAQPAALIGVTYDIGGGNATPTPGTSHTDIGAVWTYEGALSSAAGRVEHRRLTATTATAATFTAAAAAGGFTYLACSIALREAAGGDTTAPVLFSPACSATSATTASGSVSTDEGNGTLYAVITTSSTAPSVAQIQAGQNHLGAAASWAGSQVVSSTGSKTISPTGLTHSTTYWAHFQHRDAASNDSAVVTSASFTTPALQFARPNADVTDGAWVPSTGADNYAVIAETTASDADYTSSDSNSTLRVGLSSISTPDSGTQTLRVRALGSINKKLIARLIEGASTVRATVTVDPLTAAMTTYSATISGVSNYGDLDLELEVSDATSPTAPTVTFGNVGAAGTATNTTTHNVNYPASGIVAGDTFYAFLSGMSSTAGTNFTPPSGWTLVGTLEGGSGAAYGVDVGNRRVSVFKRDTLASGSETGSVTFTLTGSTTNTIFGSIINVRGPSGHTITEALSTGADTSAGTGFSATGSTSLPWQDGDLLAILVASSTDSATQSAQSITATGVTFGTRTNRRSTAATGGNDHRHILDTVPITTGSGSSAPTYAYTASASTSGPVAFLRIRAVPPTEFARVSWAEAEFPGAGSVPAPDVTGVSDATPARSSSLTVSGTNFGATQGASTITLGGVTQTVTSWGDTSIVETVSRGTNKYGVTLNVVVTTAGGSDSFAITGLEPQTGWSYVNVGTPNTTAANRLTTSPDASSGDQLAWGNIVGTGSVTVFDDLTFVADAGVVSFDFELWTSGDGWGATATQIVTATTVTKTLSLGAVVQLSNAVSLSASAAVQATQQAAANVDAAVQQGRTATADVQAAVQQALTSISNLGAAIQASGVPVSASVAAAIQEAKNIATAVSIVIQNGATNNTSVDTAIQAARSLAMQLNVVVQQAQSLPVSLGAAVQEAHTALVGINTQVQAGFTASASVEAAIAVSRTVAAQLDAVLSLARQVQTSIQTAVLATTTAQVGIDTQVEASAEKNAQINAAILHQNKTLSSVIDIAVQIGRSAAVQTDAAVQQALAIASSVQAAIQAGRSAVAGLDAYVQSQQSVTMSIEAALQQSRSSNTAVSAAILATTQSIVSLSTYVQTAFEVSALMNAAIQDTRTANTNVDAVLQLARSVATSISTAAQVARSATVSVDAQVQAAIGNFVNIDAVISNTLQAAATLNAAVSVAQSATTGIDAMVAETLLSFVQLDIVILLQNSRVIGVGVYVLDPSASPNKERDVIVTPETRDYVIRAENRDIVIPAPYIV